MRVTRALLVLLILTLAVPAGIGAYVSTQPAAANTSASGGGGPFGNLQVGQTLTLPNGQSVTVTAEMATQIASRAAQFGGDATSATGQRGAFSANSGSTSTASSEADTVSSIAVLGSVEENQTASLSFQTSGTVAEVLVQPGDYVEAGTVLARLDDSDAQMSYRQAALSLENAQINLDNLLEPPSDSEIESAQLNITSAQAAYTDAANSSSDTQIQQQQIRYQQAVDGYNLAVQVRANMSGTDEQLALQDAAVGQASVNAEIARLQLESLQTPDQTNLGSAGIRIQIAQLQYDQLMAGSDASQVANAQLAVEIAQANLDSASNTLRQLEIISPIAGVIADVNIEVGSTASPSSAAITMTDLSQLWLTAPIHELDLDEVTEGMTATIVLDALPDETFDATIEQIAWIGTESSGIVQYSARFALHSDDERIRPGMTGEATIALSS